MAFKPNPNKKISIQVNGEKFARYPIKTHLVTPNDKNPADLIKQYTTGLLRAGDIVFIAEKIISIMQGRSYPLEKVKPSKMATFLSRHVYRNPGGVGLASPQTMQLAIDEIGLIRILLAAFFAVLTKPFGLRGLFYVIAGDQARAIDGAAPYVIPPYNEYVSKGPKEPTKVAQQISKEIGYPVAIVDANDFGVRVLGSSPGIDKKLISRTLKDNPLGQTDEGTPLGILRKIK